jgi:hypothetical protein
MFVEFDRFIKIYILIPSKNTIKGQEETNMLFEKVWVHFGIPRTIISNNWYNRFSMPFGLHFRVIWIPI